MKTFIRNLQESANKHPEITDLPAVEYIKTKVLLHLQDGIDDLEDMVNIVSGLAAAQQEINKLILRNYYNTNT